MRVAFWLYEDRLPEALTPEQYAEWFPHSRVDVVRLFPLFLPDGGDERRMTIQQAVIAAQDRQLYIRRRNWPEYVCSVQPRGPLFKARTSPEIGWLNERWCPIIADIMASDWVIVGDQFDDDRRAASPSREDAHDGLSRAGEG